MWSSGCVITEFWLIASRDFLLLLRCFSRIAWMWGDVVLRPLTVLLPLIDEGVADSSRSGLSVETSLVSVEVSVDDSRLGSVKTFLFTLCKWFEVEKWCSDAVDVDADGKKIAPFGSSSGGEEDWDEEGISSSIELEEEEGGVDSIVSCRVRRGRWGNLCCCSFPCWGIDVVVVDKCPLTCCPVLKVDWDGRVPSFPAADIPGNAWPGSRLPKLLLLLLLIWLLQ